MGDVSPQTAKFNEFVRRGVADANPVYAAQVSLYQAYMDLLKILPCLR